MFQRDNKRKVDIRILPLIDVIFFLLVFFMLFTTFRATPAGLDIDLPQAETVTEQEQKQLTINISAQGQIYLEDEELTIAALQSRVANVINEDPEAVIIIEADREVFYDKIVEVMDTVRQVGAHRLALAAEEKVEEQ
ncbi:ExbD/TolR family protein [Fuchsiella alkaliacetigena]|uniref:ExbD/TolR family protein n=1 Tax=Fuchsiella alkaliacetigena TaxID=957042 RepID=UPI00200B5605|nr:biopolymer transporter ExbD [Fuchsiella alkaliacetigena]MCK8824249.1 biopolymer transporter ExbD [Fuchsiella alkaliacetigena]